VNVLGEFKIVNWHSEIALEERPLRPAEDRVSIEVKGFLGPILTVILASKALWLQSVGAGGLACFIGGVLS
jgi:hypothetical protein